MYLSSVLLFCFFKTEYILLAITKISKIEKSLKEVIYIWDFSVEILRGFLYNCITAKPLFI